MPDSPTSWLPAAASCTVLGTHGLLLHNEQELAPLYAGLAGAIRGTSLPNKGHDTLVKARCRPACPPLGCQGCLAFGREKKCPQQARPIGHYHMRVWPPSLTAPEPTSTPVHGVQGASTRLDATRGVKKNKFLTHSSLRWRCLVSISLVSISNSLNLVCFHPAVRFPTRRFHVHSIHTHIRRLHDKTPPNNIQTDEMAVQVNGDVSSSAHNSAFIEVRLFEAYKSAQKEKE